MNLPTIVIEALRSIQSNKMRASLTMIGIVIGISAVIVVVAVGEGGRKIVLGELEDFGSTALFILPNFAESRGGELYEIEDLTKGDMESLNEGVESIIAVAPRLEVKVEARYREKTSPALLVGTSSHYRVVQNLNIDFGRFIGEDDDQLQRKVAVIGGKVARSLFGDPSSAIGRDMRAGNIEVTVVGVLKLAEKGLLDALAGEDVSDNNTVFIPYSVMQKFLGREDIDVLFGQSVSEDRTDDAVRGILEVLNRRHGLWDDKYSKFMVQRMDQILSSIGILTGTFTLIIGSIAGISLVVGGIGIMNIMLVSVKERTREIGVRKALGARRRDIRLQFVVEAVMICLIGGGMGIALGIGTTALLIRIFRASGVVPGNPIASWREVISPGVVVLSFTVSTLIGLIFGIYPASRAASLDPVVALRHK
ncbi:MAG: ABC transporter permease [bacterium]